MTPENNKCVNEFSLVLPFMSVIGTYCQCKSGDTDKVNVFLEIVSIPIEDKCGELSRQECLVSEFAAEGIAVSFNINVSICVLAHE